MKQTRHSNPDEECNCYICKTGRSRDNSKVQKKVGLSKPSTVISKDNGLLAANKSESHKPKAIQDQVISNTVKICVYCKNTVGVGISHPCKPSSTVDNVIKIVDTLPPKQQNQVLHSKLKDCVGKRSGDTILSTRGSKAKVSLNPPEQKKLNFTEQNLDNFQEQTGCSSNFMEGMTNYIRAGAGRKAVPSYYRDHASKKAKLLTDSYHISHAVMDIGDGKKDKRPII